MRWAMPIAWLTRTPGTPGSVVWPAVRPPIWKWCTARYGCVIKFVIMFATKERHRLRNLLRNCAPRRQCQRRRQWRPRQLLIRDLRIKSQQHPAVPPEKSQAPATPPLPPAPPPAANRESEVKVTTSATTPTPTNKDYAGDPVKERILALAAEKTGYPQDMLDMDLDLEADLGVDTVKQAEMFAGIREIYNIPRDENRKLRDYPTLAHVIRFVYDKRPDLAVAAPVPPTPKAKEEIKPITPAPAAAPPAVPLAAPAKDSAGDSVKERILALVVEKTGYPEDMLDLDLDLEADLGVDTVKQAEMFAAIRAAYNIPRDENVKLRDYPTLAHVIRFVYERRPDLAVAAPVAATLKATEKTEPIATAPAAAPPAVTPKDSAGDSVKERILALVVEKTGYPQDMLDLDLDLEADLGVDRSEERRVGKE